MKKLIILFIAGIFSLSGRSNPVTADPGKNTLIAFQKNFPGADLLNWTVQGEMNIARFWQNEKLKYASFSSEGALLGLGWFVSLDQVPARVQLSVLTRDPGASITSIFRYAAADEEAIYYVHFDHKGKQWVDEVTADGELSFFRKIRIH